MNKKHVIDKVFLPIDIAYSLKNVALLALPIFIVLYYLSFYYSDRPILIDIQNVKYQSTTNKDVKKELGQYGNYSIYKYATLKNKDITENDLVKFFKNYTPINKPIYGFLLLTKKSKIIVLIIISIISSFLSLHFYLILKESTKVFIHLYSSSKNHLVIHINRKNSAKGSMTRDRPHSNDLNFKLLSYYYLNKEIKLKNVILFIGLILSLLSSYLYFSGSNFNDCVLNHSNGKGAQALKYIYQVCYAKYNN